MRDIERGLNMHELVRALLTDPDTGRITDIDELAPANDDRDIPEHTNTFGIAPYPSLDRIIATHNADMDRYRKWREAEEGHDTIPCGPPSVLYRYPVVYEPRVMFPATYTGLAFCDPALCSFATFVIV